MGRLVIPWQDKEAEDGKLPSYLLLSPLTNGALGSMRGGGAYWHEGPPGNGTMKLIAIKDGLVGGLNVFPDEPIDPDSVVPAERIISGLGDETRHRLVTKLMQISQLDEETLEEIRSCVRTARLKADADDPKKWSCSSCLDTPLQKERRCPFLYTKEEAEKLDVITEMNRDLVDLAELQELSQGKMPAHLTYGGHQFVRCPVGTVSERAAWFYHWVVSTEGNAVSPLEWLELPAIYNQAANEVALERHRLEKQKKEGVKVEPTGEDPLKGKDKPRRWRKPQTRATSGVVDEGSVMDK